MLIEITPFIRIPDSEFEFSFVRSSGPGGQNVNKVNSKAVMRWNILSSPVLSSETRARLIEKLGRQVTTEGDLVITSDRFRDQLRNREDCIEKFRTIMAAAAFRPKVRRKTKPTYSSRRKDQEAKSLHSLKKKQRSSRNFD